MPTWPPTPPPAGWVRLDCHLHTAASGDARTTLDQLVQRIEAVHLDIVCVTDHHSIDFAQLAQILVRDIGARVIVGEEIRTPSGELIGLYLSERIPYVLPVADVVQRIKTQGGLVYAPHPFDPERAGLKLSALEALAGSDQLDIVEVFNAKIADQRYNLQAAAFVDRFDIAPGVGSDAHDPEGVGAACIELPDFDGPREMLAALRRGRVVGQHRPHAPRYPTHRSAAQAARDDTLSHPGRAG